MKHYADTYKVIVKRPDGRPFSAVGGLPDMATARAVIESQAAFCRDRHGFVPVVKVYRVGQAGSETVDIYDDPEETAAHDAEIAARHAAYHGGQP